LLLQVFLQPGKAINNGVATAAEPSGAAVLAIREGAAVGG